jgi:beta-glucosidase
MSYTHFTYSNLTLEQEALGREDVLRVSADVTNSGNRVGAEVVQLYVRDMVGSVTRPVRELKGFQKIMIEAGQKCEVRFEIPVCELGFSGLDMQYTVEPGDFKIWIGPDAASGLEGSFKIKRA